MTKPKIVIAMPTYNEAENIGKMLDVLTDEVFPKVKEHEIMVLVIDGHSPDGTWKIVADRAKKNKSIVLLDEGSKTGLGSAYIHGFNHAIKTLKADAVMEMDADFQHNPHDIPRFIKEFDKGNDYVLGTRYMAGGSIPKEWTLDRKILSVGGNLIYQVGLLIFDIHDFTTGFRLARVKGYLEKINFEKVFSKSFAYKTRLIYEMKKRNAKIKEIPINFGLRDLGDSKMTTNTISESLKVIGTIWADRFGITR